MPFPGNTFYRSELDHSVLKELDEHNAVLNGFLSAEHGPDGGHTDITAESITAGLITGNVSANYLRLHPYKLYTVKPNDTAAFITDGTDPDVSYWYANSAAAATINGIYVNDLIQGVPGHIQLIVNNSSYIHTYQSAVVTNACRIYGCVTAVPVPPGGSILFVYDGLNLGWRYLSSSASSGTGIPANIAFTNVANVFTEDQTISKAAFATLYMQATGVNGIFRAYGTAFGVPNLAGRVGLGGDPHLALLAGYSVASGGPGELSLRAGGYELAAEQAMIDKTGVHVRLSLDTPEVRVNNTNVPAQMYVNYVDTVTPANSALLRLATYGNSCFVGTFSNTNLDIRANSNIALTIRASDLAPLFTAPFIYVGGHRVDVTADCSIPGTGGGSTLPPGLAYTNVVNQHWAYAQFFDGGANISAPLTVNGQPVTVNGPVTLNDWFDQNVKTSSSPTFANITTGGTMSAYNVNATNNVTATSMNAQTITAPAFNTPSGPGVNASTRVQVQSGPDWFLRFNGGICTYFGV